jgi:hypothetical protein
VSAVELTEGRVVALADGGEKLGILRALQLFHLVAHTSPTWIGPFGSYVRQDGRGTEG